MKDWSQFGEYSQFIKPHFERHPPKTKTFVDIGAADTLMSNTRNLLDDGWSGVRVEPFDIVSEHSAARIDRRAIMDYCGTVDLFINEVPGNHSANPEWEAATRTGKTVTLPCITIDRLFADHGLDHVDFMSLDIEGMEERVLAVMSVRPVVILVECDPSRTEGLRAILTDYTRVWGNNHNQAFVLGRESG